jgi:dihydrofolate reductase
MVAVADNGVIGREGDLPWRLSGDLKHFRATTWGHHLLMGRKNFESIGRALPGRTSVVFSRNAQLSVPDGVILAPDLQFALDLAHAAGDTEPFVVGGAQIYALAMPYISRLHLTRVRGIVPGDVLFPRWIQDGWADGTPREWKRVSTSEEMREDTCPWPYAFEVWERV